MVAYKDKYQQVLHTETRNLRIIDGKWEYHPDFVELMNIIILWEAKIPMLILQG